MVRQRQLVGVFTVSMLETAIVSALMGGAAWVWTFEAQFKQQSPRQLEGRPANGALPLSLSDAGDGTAVRLSAPGAVLHDVAHQVAHVVLQISDDVLDDVSDRDHAHDLARVQHW